MSATWIVMVGTQPGTELSKEYEAGVDVHGPFTFEQAETFRKEVEEVWEQMKPEQFVYGKPFIEVRRLVEPKPHPFYSRGAVAARNWYEED